MGEPPRCGSTPTFLSPSPLRPVPITKPIANNTINPHTTPSSTGIVVDHSIQPQLPKSESVSIVDVALSPSPLRPVPIINPITNNTINPHTTPSSTGIVVDHFIQPQLPKSESVSIVDEEKHSNCTVDASQDTSIGVVEASLGEGMGCPDDSYSTHNSKRTREIDSESSDEDFDSDFDDDDYDIHEMVFVLGNGWDRSKVWKEGMKTQQIAC